MSIVTMYLKLVLVSVGLMCISVASGGATRKCNFCFGRSDDSPGDLSNCRNFVNVTGTIQCSRNFCVTMFGTATVNEKTIQVARRSCGNDCDWLKKNAIADLYCSDCTNDYCNDDKF
ncbi:hypothetical protein PPYR_10457 [Photinus pyralis]|uniref:Protein sleepless n=1 Tax=Photinus pyralis TaxID=7054 RepID=A0A5N4AGI6_PHOPY|nr:hypothetical protein PPYR_10457 [Photinus pyralis]